MAPIVNACPVLFIVCGLQQLLFVASKRFARAPVVALEAVQDFIGIRSDAQGYGVVIPIALLAGFPILDLAFYILDQ